MKGRMEAVSKIHFFSADFNTELEIWLFIVYTEFVSCNTEWLIAMISVFLLQNYLRRLKAFLNKYTFFKIPGKTLTHSPLLNTYSSPVCGSVKYCCEIITDQLKECKNNNWNNEIHLILQDVYTFYIPVFSL